MTRSTSEIKPKQRNAKPWWKLASIRTHAIGATACLLVCTAIVHVYRFDSLSETSEFSSGVCVEEAIELLRSADDWRSVHHEKSLANEKLKSIIDSLASWIPETVDSDELHAKLESLSETNGLKLVSFEYQHCVVGSRVGVAVYTCHLRGSFSSIGRTLDGLTKMEQPISCDRISLGHGAETDSSNIICDAVISLRCPYAAEGTLAFRLMKERQSHGS